MKILPLKNGDFGVTRWNVADIDLPPNPNFTTGCPTIEWLSKGPAHAYNKPASEEGTRGLR